MSPNIPNAVMETLSRAVAAHQTGNLAQAELLYKAVLTADKRQFDAMHLLGVLEGQRGHLAEAERLMGQSLKVNASRPEAHANYARILNELKRHRDALAAADRALAINPNYVEALTHRGNALQHLGRLQEALASFDRALALKPDYVQAAVNRSMALVLLKRPDEALAGSERALMMRPGFPQALVAKGSALFALRRTAEALAAYEQALRAQPDSVDALFGRSLVFAGLRRHEEAYADCSRALALDPKFPFMRGQRAHLAALCASWAEWEAETAAIIAGVRAGEKVSSAFPPLGLTDSVADQLRGARIFVADQHPPHPQPLWPGERAAHARMRIAYASADLGDHPISYLTAGMLEQHDRSRFETFVFALDPMRSSQRMRNAFEHFIPVQDRSDRQVAQLMREHEIDIAVDLMGFTQNARTDIFAMRPAPIQISYLGFPGTMGADYIDYIIADDFLVPDGLEAAYSEKIVRLPETFQANDRSRPVADRRPSRSEVSLPERAFVFCAFNAVYKITPAMFDIWMRLLQQVDGSVLWLLRSNDQVPVNLRREAVSRGVDGERLVFAPSASYADHLARYPLADLFLDSFPYNGGTTTSDVLWAGLPLVTRAGEALASRMAGSLLHTVGLPDLVTHSAADYEALALELARDPARLARIRAQLEAARTGPLFDANRFCRHLEAAYGAMWERHQRGEAPAGIRVAPLC